MYRYSCCPYWFYLLDVTDERLDPSSHSVVQHSGGVLQLSGVVTVRHAALGAAAADAAWW